MSSILGLYSASTDSQEDDRTRRDPVGRRKITIHPNKRSRLAFLTEPTGLAVEQYKILRRRLRTLHPEGGLLLMTSPSPGEGKTLTSVNLAWCLAEGGYQTCLVDLDFRSPGVSPALGYKFEEDGIEDVLTGKRTIIESIRQVGERPLYVMGVRKSLPSPGKLLTSAVLAPVLADLRAMFQWVILDFAPIIPMSDVIEVMPIVDGALMLVRAGKTEQSMIGPALEILGSKLWGLVINECQIIGSAYYGYYVQRKK
jgi:capsular exopolysaccharide synthesis family protein